MITGGCHQLTPLSVQKVLIYDSATYVSDGALFIWGCPVKRGGVQSPRLFLFQRCRCTAGVAKGSRKCEGFNKLQAMLCSNQQSQKFRV